MPVQLNYHKTLLKAGKVNCNFEDETNKNKLILNVDSN